MKPGGGEHDSWLNDGHIVMVFPGQYARIVSASHPAGTAFTAGETA